jgi:hypothetical protein
MQLNTAQPEGVQMDRNRDEAPESLPRLAVTIDDVPRILGVKRTRIFEAVRTKQLTVRKAGRATIVEIEELQRWLKSLPTRGRQPDATATAQRYAATV